VKVAFEFDISDPADLTAFKSVFANIIGQGGVPSAPPTEATAPGNGSPAAPTPPAPPKAAPPPPKPATPPPPAPAATVTAPAEEAPTAEGGSEALQQEFRDALQEYSNMTNAVTVATFLRKELGYPNVGSIPADKWQDALDKVQQKMAELAMQ
jgi:hypothetical protein